MENLPGKRERDAIKELARSTEMRKRGTDKGITLIELIVMIMLFSTLTALAMQKVSIMASDAADTSAKALLATLRTANELVYSKKQITGALAYTMEDVVAFLDNSNIEHIDYSDQEMKWHVRIAGREYWYTMSSPGTGLPSIDEWKPISSYERGEPVSSAVHDPKQLPGAGKVKADNETISREAAPLPPRLSMLQSGTAFFAGLLCSPFSQ